MNFTKEINNKILSIRNTQKITKAMEMVAASKMKKLQKYINLSLPYREQIFNIINNFTSKHFLIKHIFFQVNVVKSICYIIVATDRGLVSGLNINLFKKLLVDFKICKKNKINIKLVLFGMKAVWFFNSFDIEKILQIVNIGDKPKFDKFNNIIKFILNLYNKSQIDQLYIVYNKFINTLVQKPLINKILPIEILSNIKQWDYLYESDYKELINIVLIRYIESLIYQCIMENLLSEQSCRMVSMKYATDNANTLINDYILVFNKIRQTNITQEISEIFSGII